MGITQTGHGPAGERLINGVEIHAAAANGNASERARSGVRASRLECARQPGTAVLYTAVLFDAHHTEGTYAAAEALRARFERVVIVTPRDTIATASGHAAGEAV